MASISGMSSTVAYRIQSMGALAPPPPAERFLRSAVRCNVGSGGGTRSLFPIPVREDRSKNEHEGRCEEHQACDIDHCGLVGQGNWVLLLRNAGCLHAGATKHAP
jgi:hypothetical protein